MSMLLAIVSLLLAIIALPWLRKPAERLCSNIRERILIGRALQNTLPAVKSIRKGYRQSTTKDFMVCEWDHMINIDADGDTKTSIDCLFVNISNTPILDYIFPIYFDLPPKQLNAWAKIGRSSFDIQPSAWNAETGNGLLAIPFSTPLEPRKAIRLKFGYSSQASYGEGNEWWEWYIGSLHSMFRLYMTFDDAWKINNLRGVISGCEIIPDQPVQKGSQIRWFVKAPIPGHKYRLEFLLSRAPVN